MKTKLFTTVVNPYGAGLWLALGDTVGRAYIGKMKRAFPGVGREDFQDAEGLTLQEGSETGVLLAVPALTHNLIAHETSHAVFNLLGHRGLDLKEDSKEAYAYLTGWMTEWIYRRIREVGFKVR